MIQTIQYDLKNDGQINLETSDLALGSVYKISAGTEAGRKDPGAPSKPNEDAFCVLEDEDKLSLAVFDGGSSQKPIPELGEETGARFASHTLKEIFESLPARLDATEKLQICNQKLGEKLRGFPSVDYKDLNSVPAATATFVEVDFARQLVNVSHVGDSFAMVEYKDGSTEVLTNDLVYEYDKRNLQLIGEIARERGITPREAREDPRVREAIMATFQNIRNNSDGRGYGMVNGDPNMDIYIYNLALSLENVRSILLGSDGIIPPGMDEQSAYDRKKLFEILRKGGVNSLIATTREAENKDPDRWLLRFKHSDDATGVYVEIIRPNLKQSL